MEFSLYKDKAMVWRAPIEEAPQQLIWQSMRQHILYISHIYDVACHAGQRRNYDRMHRDHYRLDLAQDVHHADSDCHSRAKNETLLKNKRRL